MLNKLPIFLRESTSTSSSFSLELLFSSSELLVWIHFGKSVINFISKSSRIFLKIMYSYLTFSWLNSWILHYSSKTSSRTTMSSCILLKDKRPRSFIIDIDWQWNLSWNCCKTMSIVLKNTVAQICWVGSWTVSSLTSSPGH